MFLLQTTTVQDYRQQFELLSAPLLGLPSSVLEAAFMNGLRPNIQAELRQIAPLGLPIKMRMVQRIEEKQMALEVYQAGLLPWWLKPIVSASNIGQLATHVMASMSCLYPFFFFINKKQVY